MAQNNDEVLQSKQGDAWSNKKVNSWKDYFLLFHFFTCLTVMPRNVTSRVLRRLVEVFLKRFIVNFHNIL